MSKLRLVYSQVQEQMKDGLIYIAGQRFLDLLRDIVQFCQMELENVSNCFNESD